MLRIEGNLVYLKTKAGTYRGAICGGDNSWYVSFPGFNHTPFLDLRLDKNKVQQEVLGYNRGGDWPWCNSKEDVITLLHFLSSTLLDNESFINLKGFV